MKSLYLTLLFSFLFLTTNKGQNDCCNAEPLFSGLPVTIPSSAGNGVLEDLSACSCLATDEHDSHWFSFECIQSGTFEMMITPANLSADFDFALYANNCPCNGTTVVSCDYTGPITPPGPFVPTGISSTPMATFGVPGLTEFQPTVNLTAGTVYYIIADNITTNGAGFTIEFAGTAGIGPPPFNPPPAAPAPLTGSLTACPGATLAYNVPNSANFSNYEWAVTPPLGNITGNGSNSVTVQWTTLGSYQLCVIGEEDCATSPPTCITVNVNPIITVPVMDDICMGESYTAADGQVYFVGGVYNMNFTSWQGCDSIVPLILTQVPTSMFVLAQEICEGDCIVFGGQTVCQTGIYEDILTNQYGCDSTVTLYLVTVPNEAIITGGGTFSCNGASILLDGSSSTGGANMTFQWTNQSGQTVGNQPTLTVTVPGTYTLTTSSTVGNSTCTDQASVTITANNTPPAGVTATGGTIDCANSTVALAGNSTSSGVTYAWTGPGGYTSSQQNPTVSVTGTYILTVTGTNGCTATATASVTGDSGLPNASASGDTLNCTNATVSLSGNSTTPGVTYGWTGPGGYTSNQQNPAVSVTGTYTLTVTATNGCSAQATALVDEDVDDPDAMATGGTLDCGNPSLTLTGNSTTTGVSFAWTGPGGYTSNNQNPAVTQAGTYILTVTAGNGCTASASAMVSQNAGAPDVSATGGVLDCSITSINLQGSSATPGVTWNWTGPGGFTSANQNPAVTAPGTYTLVVTAANGCTASDDATVTQDINVPNATATGGTLTCMTGSITLQGNSTTTGITWGWTGPGGFTSSQQNPVATQAGTYTLTVTAANGCTATASAPVPQDAGVPDIFAAGGMIDCNISSIQLSANSNTAGVTYSWTGPGGFTSSQAEPVVSVVGNYILTVTAPNNCTAQATAVVFLNNMPPDIQAEGGTLTCDSTEVTLSGSSVTAGATFSWTGPGGFISNLPNLAVSTTGNYVLTVSGANGCSASQTAVVDEDITPPDVQASGGTLDCDDMEIPLDGGSATSGASFAWTGPGGYAASVADTLATQPGDYILTVTATSGCTASATAVVLQDTQKPDVSATGGILSCNSPSVSLIGVSNTPGVTWLWTGPGGFTSTQQNPSVSTQGNYVLTVTAPNGCTASDPATVGQNTNVPNATATGGTVTCTQASISLAGNSTTMGVSWSWTGPGGFTSTQQNPVVTNAGNYVLTVTATNGCKATATAVLVQDKTLPGATATGGTLTCTTGTLTLAGNSATAGVTWSWTGPGGFTSTQQNPAVTVAGNYILTVTAANGCTSTATAAVNQDASTPNANATGGSLNCNITSIALSGSSSTAGVTWSWTGPGGFTSTQQNPTVTLPGTYTLTVTATNGCTGTDNATVVQNINPPNASATGGTITCQNPSATLTGSSTTSNVTYAWTGPGGFTSTQQNPVVTQGGTYTLTVTGTNGCKATASAAVTVDANVPSATATGGTITCLVSQVQLNGTSNQAGVTWSWSGPGGFTSSQQNPIAGAGGTYTLVITNAAGCKATATAQVIEDIDLPAVVIAGPGELDCITPTVTLDGTGSDSGPGFTFQWATANGNFASGQNTLTPVVDAAGIYTLEIVNQASGCSASQNVEVMLSDAAPSGAAIIATDPSCFGKNDGSLVIEAVDGGTPPYTYSLNNGAFGSGNSFAGLPPGVYSITVKDDTGCEWSTQINLAAPLEVQVMLDGVNLGAGPLTLGESLELEAVVTIPANLIQSVVWSPEEIAAGCDTCLFLTLTPNSTSTYSVVVTDINGCTATDALTVPVDRTRPVFVPNAFSPNGDGINDLVTVFGGASVSKVNSFLVFDRWGETVYQYFNFLPNDPALGWDGDYRGKKVDTGVFTWFAEVEFIDGEKFIFEGDVTLLR